MHIDMIAVTVQSNKSFLNEVKETKLSTTRAILLAQRTFSHIQYYLFFFSDLL